jgi:cytochrome c-type biogenesis protein CcmE
MTPRRRRLYWVLAIVAGVGIAGALALRAFQQNVMFYFDPSRIAAGEVKSGQRFRLGGMVEKGSLVRTPGSLEVRFVVTDFRHSVPVRYDKVLPDLFREGAGVVAHGRWIRTAPSSPMRCWPSTMRNTCRPRSRARSSRRRPAAPRRRADASSWVTTR